MSNYKLSVGNVEMVSLTDGHRVGRNALQAFPDSTLDQWQKEFPEFLHSSGGYYLRDGSVALRSGGKLIVVDTGLQNQVTLGALKPPDAMLLEDMRQKGVDREAVDIVVMTHLHRDHVGWNLTDGRLTFPRARYLVSKKDWEYWTQPPAEERQPCIREQVMPLDELRVMDLVDGEHRITSEVTTFPTPGHTPGHISIAIHSRGQRGFVLGDVADGPFQAQYTHWSPSFDVDRKMAAKTRELVFSKLEAERALVYGGHYPDPGFGRFGRSQGRRIWQGVNTEGR